MRYAWPGNMREFQNAVERMVNLSFHGPIPVASLPEEIQRPAGLRGMPAQGGPAGTLRERRAQIKRTLAEQERNEILALMAEHQGNLSLTARTLGISRTSLYRKLGG